jgi:hypothetical protein
MPSRSSRLDDLARTRAPRDEKKPRAASRLRRMAEKRRRMAALAITSNYLQYIEDHTTDQGFSVRGTSTVELLRKAALDARLMIETFAGLVLTEEGRKYLRSVTALAKMKVSP